VQPRAPYRSPFDISPDDCSRLARMLRRVEPALQALLEDQRITKRVAMFVAGGGSKDERLRRADIALYARSLVLSEGWPDLWILYFFAQVDSTACASRRARGLRRLPVEETCGEVRLPDAPPPPRRSTNSQRQAALKKKLAERLRKLARAVEELDDLGPPASA
jgi:hypothetical protein